MVFSLCHTHTRKEEEDSKEGKGRVKSSNQDPCTVKRYMGSALASGYYRVRILVHGPKHGRHSPRFVKTGSKP